MRRQTASPIWLTCAARRPLYGLAVQPSAFAPPLNLARSLAAYDGRDRAIWNLDYANSMQKVYADFHEDLDVATIYADALMNLTPWKLWDIRTGKPAEGARTIEVNKVIERALALPGGDSHPGLLHLYIHLKEMSLSPESALTMADKLRGHGNWDNDRSPVLGVVGRDFGQARLGVVGGVSTRTEAEPPTL